uniref:Uncharacterized protein n=1 Tax=Lactuca sativa TaxID=4236 RepID=A0A9R1WTG7_LACSA|nr:hypothetical protein LSAT_V11C900467810 [Lactuca sativa]
MREQYRAPFVEEGWNNEDCVDLDAFLVLKRNLIPIPVNDVKILRQEEENVFKNDIVEFLNKIIDEPEILPQVPEVEETGNSCDLKDFIEMDDLVGPQAGISDSIPEFGSLAEFDFYHEFISGFVEYGPENSGLESKVLNHGNDEFQISYDLWDYNNHRDSNITTTQTTQQVISHPS